MSICKDTLILQALGEELRFVQARVQSGRTVFADACSFWAGDRGEDSNALTDQNTLDALAEYVSQQGWAGRDLLCVLSGSSVACHHYEMPPLSGNQLRQAVLLKLGQQLHFNVSEAVVAVDSRGTVVGSDGKKIIARVTAAHRNLTTAVIEAATRMGLNVRAIVAAPDILTALALQHRSESEGVDACLYIDEHASTLIALHGSTPCVTTELPVGLADFSRALMRPIINGEDVIQLESADATILRDEVGIPRPDMEIPSLGVVGAKLLPLLEPVLQHFVKHLTQWLTFASTSVDAEPVKVLRVVGPGSRLPGLIEALGSRASFDAELVSWGDDTIEVSEAARSLGADSLVMLAGAMAHWSSVPDLIPEEVRSERRLKQLRRSIVISGPIAAAAIVVFAVLFDGVSGDMSADVSVGQTQLNGIAQVVGENAKQVIARETAGALKKQLDDFSKATPCWVGVFKELSVLLPREVQVTGVSVNERETGLWLTVEGVVYAEEKGPGFDRVVEQTLRMLQRSSFFKGVQLVTANREEPEHSAYEQGVVSVDLQLAYPQQDSEV